MPLFEAKLTPDMLRPFQEDNNVEAMNAVMNQYD